MADQPQQRAVALRYDPTQDAAPKVVAKGRGRLAEQILEEARKHAVPIQHDANLVRVLGRLNLDQEIPPELYQAVAVILAFLHKVNHGTRR